VFLAAQIVAAAFLLYFVGRALGAQWATFRDQPLKAHLGWGDILASGALVLGTYALLVQTWRILLARAGASLSFWSAARIWSVSNLWRYVPGKLWQIGAMSALATRENVPAVAAAGSAVLSTVLNVATGLALMLLLGWRWLDLIRPEAHAVAIGLLAAAVVGLLLLPFVLPLLGAMAARFSGRDIRLQAPSASALAVAVAGNALAWLLYGVAFLYLVRGVLGDAPGATWEYIAVYTASYVVGYLFLILPGGIGPREAVMVGLLTSLNLTTPKQALLVAAASRVWLTILEIVPGVLFLAHDGARGRSTTTLPTDVPKK
jgi:hypothetical protein